MSLYHSLDRDLLNIFYDLLIFPILHSGKILQTTCNPNRTQLSNSDHFLSLLNVVKIIKYHF